MKGITVVQRYPLPIPLQKMSLLRNVTLNQMKVRTSLSTLTSTSNQKQGIITSKEFERALKLGILWEREFLTRNASFSSEQRWTAFEEKPWEWSQSSEMRRECPSKELCKEFFPVTVADVGEAKIFKRYKQNASDGLPVQCSNGLCDVSEDQEKDREDEDCGRLLQENRGNEEETGKRRRQWG